jgi:hypothetical protein
VRLLQICNWVLYFLEDPRYALRGYPRALKSSYSERCESDPKLKRQAAMASNNPLPRLRPNYKKILESVLFLISEAERRNLYVTEYDIVKSIFLADVAHLNQYARPITFDNFVAMKDGPVPSATRDVLQPEFNPRYQFSGEVWPPWDRERSPADGPLAHKFVKPKRRADLRVLSETDVHALSEALSVIKSLRFSEIRSETHKHPAYTEAWERRGDRKAAEMDYAKLLDAADEEMIEDLVYSSK